MVATAQPFTVWTGANGITVAVAKTAACCWDPALSRSLCLCELIQWLEQQGANRTKTMLSVVRCSRGLHMDPSPPVLFLRRITTPLHQHNGFDGVHVFLYSGCWVLCYSYTLKFSIHSFSWKFIFLRVLPTPQSFWQTRRCRGRRTWFSVGRTRRHSVKQRGRHGGPDSLMNRVRSSPRWWRRTIKHTMTPTPTSVVLGSVPQYSSHH